MFDRHAASKIADHLNWRLAKGVLSRQSLRVGPRVCPEHTIDHNRFVVQTPKNNCFAFAVCKLKRNALDISGRRRRIDVIRHSIVHGPQDEALYLQRYESARDSLKDIIEGRDEDYAAIIRSLVTNKKVSNKLLKLYPSVFSEEGLSKRIERAVLKAFEWQPDADADDEVQGLD